MSQMRTKQRAFDNGLEQPNDIPFKASVHKTQAWEKFTWQKPATYLSLVLLGARITFSGNYLFSRNPLSPQLPGSQVSSVPELVY